MMRTLPALRLFAVVLFTALLSACAGIPPQPVSHPQQVWRAHVVRMQAITRFMVSAEGGVRAGTHGGTLLLHWRVHPHAYQMTGYGPFGRLIFRLRVNATGARLRTARGRFRGRDAAVLLRRLTGWHLPVAGLRYWILGIPAPGPVTAQGLDRRGLLARLRQEGWVVRYRRYRATHLGRVPRLLTLTYPGHAPGAPSVIVTIRIDRWGFA